ANLAAVAASDLAATIPARLEQGLPAALVTRPLPLVGVEFGYGMIWHPRGEASPALRWLRGVVGEVAQDGA
ncbi:MAG: LysR family transcriptional regulator, partial [Rhodobacterales bacterium]|nr:LysR family transcriptional regulator [Rhodobacterales bacterium]